MEIREIIDIQRKCRKQAREMTKQAYNKYDAIWAEGIQITPELKAKGENVIGRINAKMPNMLMYRQDRPDIEEIAVKYGFENSQALVDYLLAYEPRKSYEESEYQYLLVNALAGCAPEEIDMACQMSPAQIMSVIRDCRELASYMLEASYEKYDEVWAGKIRITPELYKYGRETVSEINRRMPNLLTHNPMASALDQVAMEYKFESTQELVDWLLDYEPRVSVMENICDRLVRQELGLPDYIPDWAMNDCGNNSGNLPYEVDEVPF